MICFTAFRWSIVLKPVRKPACSFGWFWSSVFVILRVIIYGIRSCDMKYKFITHIYQKHGKGSCVPCVMGPVAVIWRINSLPMSTKSMVKDPVFLCSMCYGISSCDIKYKCNIHVYQKSGKELRALSLMGLVAVIWSMFLKTPQVRAVLGNVRYCRLAINKN